MTVPKRANQILAVLTDVYGSSPWSLAQIEADLAQDTTDYFYSYVDGDLVGFMSLLHLVGETELTNIAVKTVHQGNGLAKALLTHLDKLSQPCFLEVRQSNLSAQKLYEKAGFEVVGRRKNYYHNPDEDALLMRRDASS